MRIWKPISKAAVLLLFISLLAGFVAYRSGYFNNHFKEELPSPELLANTLFTQPADTAIKPLQNDSSQKVMMYSSKSMIIKEYPSFIKPKLTKQQKDSLIIRAKSDSLKKTNDAIKRTRMSSSKSGYIITDIDSALLKNYKKKKKNNLIE